MQTLLAGGDVAPLQKEKKKEEEEEGEVTTLTEVMSGKTTTRQICAESMLRYT